MQKIMFLLLFTAVYGNAQIISEICASNSESVEIGVDEFPDWIEFYNDTEEPINMAGYAVTDDPDDLNKWSFIIGSIAPGDYLVVPAEKGNPDPTVISFGLNKRGELLLLVDPEGIIVDSVRFPGLETDHSYGCIDGRWYYFKQPTPALPNWLETGYKGYAEIPVFSAPSGYYPPGTLLQIYGGEYESELFYSTNGSNPIACESYSVPIELNETVTINSIARGDSLIDSQPVYQTYFVGHFNHHLPIINLCVDSLTLFDEETGICMPGPDADDEFPFSGANFWGEEKVDIWFQHFDPDFQLVEELPAELKIHGGSGSRVRPMKSFQIRAKGEKFKYPYFKQKSIGNLERLLIRNGGNDYCITCVKDGVLHNYFIDNGLDVDLVGFTPAVIYINGNYHGVQNIREKVDRYYLEANYDVNPETVNLLEGKNLLEVEGSKTGFEDVIAYISTNSLADSVHYNWVRSRVDLNALVDYFVIELYLNNRDWPNNNLKLWNSPEQPLWRYICYDLDVAFRYVTEALEDRESLRFILEHYVDENPHVRLLHALLENEHFKTYFINRYADLMSTCLQPDAMFEAFMNTKSRIETDMIQHYEKWCGTISQWDERFFGTYGFVYSRQDIVYNELVSLFAQNGAADIVVDSYPYNAGMVKLNSLKISEFPFPGRYLDGNHITLEAIPKNEGNFLYWQNARTGEQIFQRKITVNPVDGDRYVAIFDFEGKIFDLSVIPNPIKEMANIRFSLPRKTDLQLIISNAHGQTIQVIDHFKEMPPGNHFITWNTSNLSSGMYILTLLCDYGKETTQLVKT